MSEEFNIQLELKERINYTEILEVSIKNQKEVIKSDTFKLSKLHLMILDDLTDIPSSWYDQQFNKDIQKVIVKKTVPNIVRFAGTPLSKEYMKKNEMSLTKESTEIDYFKLKMAIRNLLDRRNMLIRKDKIEQSTGVNLEYESFDDFLDTLQAEEKEEE